eukprot:Protomagalhaensia_sp_Gyna_25__5859@NODE_878_length_2480_cov_764_775092_g692_i0_p1_GENE_NODE_878_length_2480_cov_764_775092_g692_i0NODE_878_length_2480_cov_764_775092_g692_i0_p1_ORF_typecomplete_len420_score73_17PAN_4/PF14295_6/1_4e03PAN_4/PF14295_6/2_1e07PAN_4/PF14295_6/5_8e02PAN_1/PF00024_26/1_2e02PAN_1/PF00024_26/8_1e05Vac17/PF17321_2/0_25Hamartin/PF04388_12/0_59KAR9/PF08580_10/0_8_NODE_878_length_2480_cov_764_775092_g692_i01711430
MRHLLYGVLVAVSGSAAAEQAACSQVVARSSTMSNRECQAWCEEGGSHLEEAFHAHCTTAHYKVVNGRTVVDNDCFEKWVYGYVEPETLAGFRTLEAGTPAQCQLLCQETAECVNWVWSASVHTRHKECVLKSEAQVSKALGILTDSQPPGNLDVRYCNFQMGWSCSNLFNCLDCDGRPRCVWESDLHVSGWKFCGNQNSCESQVFPTTPTPQPPETQVTGDTTVEEQEADRTTSEEVEVEHTSTTSTTPQPPENTAQRPESSEASSSQLVTHPPETTFTTGRPQPPVKPTQDQTNTEEETATTQEGDLPSESRTTTTTPQPPVETQSKTGQGVMATEETGPLTSSSVQPPVVTHPPFETIVSFPIQTPWVSAPAASSTPSTPQAPYPLGRRLEGEAVEPRVVLRFAKRPQELQVEIEN